MLVTYKLSVVSVPEENDFERGCYDHDTSSSGQERVHQNKFQESRKPVQKLLWICDARYFIKTWPRRYLTVVLTQMNHGLKAEDRG